MDGWLDGMVYTKNESDEWEWVRWKIITRKGREEKREKKCIIFITC
jgi:hypothetical protein